MKLICKVEINPDVAKAVGSLEAHSLTLHVVDADNANAEQTQYGKVVISLDDIAKADLANVGVIKLQKMKVCQTINGTPTQRTVYLLCGTPFKDTDDP